ncbi:PucR family transcriptional regulator [Arthrobacter sp. NPDC090010]|uniref:PucR family transcriptional regulator n=1 Tax=Arthrobacter sp. NPDC090010 TaxID=3363942 RepID=UPI0037FB1EB9
MFDAASPSAAAPGQAVPLTACLQLLGPVVTLLNPSEDALVHAVTDVVIHDSSRQVTLRDRIVLAIGMTAGSEDFAGLLDTAVVDGAAAVMFKATGMLLEDLRLLAAGRLALLVVDDDADWERLISLARASVAGVAMADTASGVRLGDLYAFANTTASMLGGAASFVDTLGRILAYSTLPGQPIDEVRRMTTLSLQELTPPGLDEDFKAVYGAPGAVVVESGEQGLARLALAVRAGGELLGSLWIIDPGPGLRERSLDSLNRMAPLIGLHMLHARSAADFGERRNADLIRTVIEDPAHAAFAAAQLNLEASDGFALAAFSVVHPEPGSLDSVRDLQRLLHLVNTVCRVHFTSSHAALVDSVVYALMPATGKSPRETHRKVAGEIHRYAAGIGANPVLAAVGGIARTVEGLPESRDEALRLMHHLWKQTLARGGSGAPAAALAEDYRTPLNVDRVGAYLEHEGLTESDALTEIRDFDSANGTEYLPTLGAYFEANGNIAAMAESLHVHNNTVRYRLGRLAQDTGVELSDPDTRLWLWLRLRTETGSL